MAEPIRILFNATAVGSSGGVTVLEGLMGAMFAVPDVTCRFLVPAELEEDLATYSRREVVFPHLGSTARRLVWEQTGLPKLLEGGEWDVLVGLTNTVPLRGIPSAVRTVVLIQNIAPLVPDVVRTYRGLGRLRLQVLRRMTEASVRRADLTLLFSEAGCELVRKAVPGARVVAVPPGGFPSAVAPSSRRIATTPHLVVLADLYRYKGVEDVVRAIARPDLGAVHLRVLGSPVEADYAERLVRLTRDLGVGRRVRFLGRTSRLEVVEHLRSSIALVQPSRCESLALPVLEALDLGVPVISTEIPVVRELSGDRAVFYPPGDIDALALAVTQVLSEGVVPHEHPRIETSRDWHHTALAISGLARGLHPGEG